MTRPTPMVSVVMPTYRAADAVAAAVAAVRAQSVEDLELIVVDDASGDGTADAARRACQGDVRCRVIERPTNGGSTRARSTGIAAATGQFVWQVDVDDQWDPRALEVLVDEAERTGADVVIARARRVERNGRTTTMEGVAAPTLVDRAELPRLVLDGTVRGYLWNKLFRRALLDSEERTVLTSQDDHLVVLAALERVRRVALVPEVVYTYLDTPGSISDSSMLRLDNVATAWRATLDWAVRTHEGELPRDLTDFFTSWFLLVPVLTTPAHHRWPRRDARDVRRRYAPLLTWRCVAATLRHDPRRGLHAAALKLLGPAFDPTYRVVGRLAGFSLR